MTITLDEFEQFCGERGYDYGIRVETAAECAWTAEVRVTKRPNRPDGPDRSYVTFNSGAGDPEDAMLPAMLDVIDWIQREPPRDRAFRSMQEVSDQICNDFDFLLLNASQEDVAASLRRIEYMLELAAIAP